MTKDLHLFSFTMKYKQHENFVYKRLTLPYITTIEACDITNFYLQPFFPMTPLLCLFSHFLRERMYFFVSRCFKSFQY